MNNLLIPLVIIESPFAGTLAPFLKQLQQDVHVAYARLCLAHSLSLGEAPIASHLLYTQALDDDCPMERAQGIDAGLAWRAVATKAVFYEDLGRSKGMQAALDMYEAESVPVEVRFLYNQWAR